MKVPFVFFLMIFCLVTGLMAEEPWSVDDRHPVFPTVKQPGQRSIFLSLYQDYISSWDGARCHMNPTCSGFASSSFSRFGLINGLVMTADRLMHEAAYHELFRFVRVGDQYRFDHQPDESIPPWSK